MAEMTLTLVVTEQPDAYYRTDDGDEQVAHVTCVTALDEHGCEVGWWSIGPADFMDYEPYAAHPEADLLGWPEGLALPFGIYNNVDDMVAAPSREQAVEGVIMEHAYRLDQDWYRDPEGQLSDCAPGEDGAFPEVYDRTVEISVSVPFRLDEDGILVSPAPIGQEYIDSRGDDLVTRSRTAGYEGAAILSRVEQDFRLWFNHDKGWE